MNKEQQIRSSACHQITALIRKGKWVEELKVEWLRRWGMEFPYYKAGECNMYTNYFKGACDCPYKKSCHEPRQRLQARFREESGDPDIRKCDFYKYFI